jgi:hypothetical protein
LECQLRTAGCLERWTFPKRAERPSEKRRCVYEFGFQ